MVVFYFWDSERGGGAPAVPPSELATATRISDHQSLVVYGETLAYFTLGLLTFRSQIYHIEQITAKILKYKHKQILLIFW